jgi:hypothetical protein
LSPKTRPVALWVNFGGVFAETEGGGTKVCGSVVVFCAVCAVQLTSNFVPILSPSLSPSLSP